MLLVVGFSLKLSFTLIVYTNDKCTSMKLRGILGKLLKYGNIPFLSLCEQKWYILRPRYRIDALFDWLVGLVLRIKTKTSFESKLIESFS